MDGAQAKGCPDLIGQGGPGLDCEEDSQALYAPKREEKCG